MLDKDPLDVYDPLSCANSVIIRHMQALILFTRVSCPEPYVCVRD